MNIRTKRRFSCSYPNDKNVFEAWDFSSRIEPTAPFQFEGEVVLYMIKVDTEELYRSIHSSLDRCDGDSRCRIRNFILALNKYKGEYQVQKEKHWTE